MGSLESVLVPAGSGLVLREDHVADQGFQLRHTALESVTDKRHGNGRARAATTGQAGNHPWSGDHFQAIDIRTVSAVIEVSQFDRVGLSLANGHRRRTVESLGVDQVGQQLATGIPNLQCSVEIRPEPPGIEVDRQAAIRSSCHRVAIDLGNLRQPPVDGHRQLGQRLRFRLPSRLDHLGAIPDKEHGSARDAVGVGHLPVNRTPGKTGRQRDRGGQFTRNLEGTGPAFGAEPVGRWRHQVRAQLPGDLQGRPGMVEEIVNIGGEIVTTQLDCDGRPGRATSRKRVPDPGGLGRQRHAAHAGDNHHRQRTNSHRPLQPHPIVSLRS